MLSVRCVSLFWRRAGLLLAALSIPFHGYAFRDASTDLYSAVPAAACGPGAWPETGLQGQVPLKDRLSGRNQQGYRCNMELVGQHQGEGAAIVSTMAGHCAYMGTSYGNAARKKRHGVQVIDVTPPSLPKWVMSLDTRAFHIGTWESLKVNPQGTMIAGAGVGSLIGAGRLDLYDVRDCTQPKLLNKSATTGDSAPVTNVAHEGEWSPDGQTYWTSSTAGGSLSAIDVSDPSKPKNLYFGGSTIYVNHGMSFNADGTRMYLASIFPAGLVILDVSDIQLRRINRKVRQIARVTWPDGVVTQRATPVTIQGKPYLIAIDEIGALGLAGGMRFIDIGNEKDPVVVSHIRLEIQLPQHADKAFSDGLGNGTFGYAPHYCSVDRPIEPTALACGYFQSGIRVFDIRNPLKPREIAYFNPPAQVGKGAQLPGSDHANAPTISKVGDTQIIDPLALQSIGLKLTDMSADWCASPPHFVNGQIWVTCTDNGFMVLKFTNGAYPLAP